MKFVEQGYVGLARRLGDEWVTYSRMSIPEKNHQLICPCGCSGSGAFGFSVPARGRDTEIEAAITVR